MKHLNDRRPNFRDDDGSLYLVRCFSCGGDSGRENWAMAVASGTCAWCGWSETVVSEPVEPVLPSEPVEPETAPARKRTDDNLRSVFG